MRNRAGWGMVAGMTLLMVSPAGAEEPMGVSQPQEFEGRILDVDAQRRLFTMEPAHAGESSPLPPEFAFTDQTVITRAGVRLQRDDLKATNDPVVILSELREGIPTAIAVTYEQPQGIRRASGTVDGISLGEGVLILTPDRILGSGEPKRFHVTEDTLVTHEGQRRYLAVLQPGDEISVEYVDSEELPMAHTVTVTAMVQGSPWSPWGWWRMMPQSQRPTSPSGGSPIAR